MRLKPGAGLAMAEVRYGWGDGLGVRPRWWRTRSLSTPRRVIGDGDLSMAAAEGWERRFEWREGEVLTDWDLDQALSMALLK